MKDWLNTPLGDYWFATQIPQLREHINFNPQHQVLFIGHGALLAKLHEIINIRLFCLLDGFSGVVEGTKQRDDMCICSAADMVAIAHNSMDVVLLANKISDGLVVHNILREIHRILKPGGLLVISEVNPFSPWAVALYLWQKITSVSHKINFITITRLKDWLALLGFDIIQVSRFCYGLPLNYTNFLTKQLTWESKAQSYALPCGGGYIVVAKKQEMGWINLAPAWSVPSGAVVS